jgi:hypothetical protein
MSNEKARPTDTGSRGSVLAALVDEARSLPSDKMPPEMPKMNWDKVDAGLFARIEREAAETRARASHKGQPWPWLMLGGVAAAAAAAAVVMQPARTPVSEVASQVTSQATSVESSAGDLAFQTGAGEVRVDGARAHAGLHARQGESIETHGAKAVFESQERVSWLLEDQSKVFVERAGSSSPVVLALANGAVEAQVKPVLAGEAFAIDVGGVRVAVHGTHLRVARNGDHVVVDLTEGVVSIGAPPKVGSTYGTLVTAPAHVEFQASALGTSLVVEHEADAIRGAANITSPISEEMPTASVAPPSASPSPVARVDEPTAAPVRNTVPITAKGHPATVLKRIANADTFIDGVVKTCWAKNAAGPADPGTTGYYSSEATFDINPDGSVRRGIVNFNPPLPLAVHQCALDKMFATPFAASEEGAHRVGIVPQ